MIPDALEALVFLGAAGIDLTVRARAQRNQISLPCICLHGDLSGSGVGATLSARGGCRPLRRNCLFCGRRRIGARIPKSIHESLDAGSDESIDESLGEGIDARSDESPGAGIDASSDESHGASSGESLGKSIAASSGESLNPRNGKTIGTSIAARRIGATAAETFRQPARAGPMERARGLGGR